MEKYYICEEIAEKYRVKKRTVWSWLRTGKLTGIRVGKEYRISEKDIQAFEERGKNRLSHQKS